MTLTNGDTRTQAELAAEWGVSTRTVRRRQKATNGGQPKVSTNGHRAAPEIVRPRVRPRPAVKGRPWPLVAVMLAGAAMVAAATAIPSYVHIRHLAELRGMGGLAPWVPLGIDGLVVTCAAALTINRRSAIAWAGTGIALVATVWANVLAVPQEPVAQAMAGYSPVALACVVHLVLRQLGDR